MPSNAGARVDLRELMAPRFSATRDFIKFNSEVRRVSVLYTSSGTITSIGIAKERRPLKTMPEVVGDVDYFSPFVESASSSSIYRYTKAENSAPKFSIFRITIGQEIRLMCCAKINVN